MHQGCVKVSYQSDLQTAKIRPTTKNTKEHERTHSGCDLVDEPGVLLRALRGLCGFLARLAVNWYEPQATGRQLSTSWQMTFVLPSAATMTICSSRCSRLQCYSIESYQSDFQPATIRRTTKHTKEHERQHIGCDRVYKSGSLLRALRGLRGFLAGLTAKWYQRQKQPPAGEENLCISLPASA
jgi:hypothetical protein